MIISEVLFNLYSAGIDFIKRRNLTSVGRTVRVDIFIIAVDP